MRGSGNWAQASKQQVYIYSSVRINSKSSEPCKGLPSTREVGQGHIVDEVTTHNYPEGASQTLLIVYQNLYKVSISSFHRKGN